MLLLRQSERKFGGEAAERQSALLAGIAESERLADVGELIIDCTFDDDLIARVESAS